MLRTALSRVILRARRARSWAHVLVALVLTVCGDPPSGPGSGAERAVRLAFQPAFQQMDRALFQVVSGAIDNVHLVLRDAVGNVVLDTVVAFPPGQDSVAIAATVQVRGESERFAVKFELRAGTQTMFEGTQDVVAKPGVNTSAPTTVPLVFVGPGARATRVTVSPTSATLQAGDTVRLSANVVDASGAPIADALLLWTSSNESSATVNGSGMVTALPARGTAVISATTLSGISGSATVRVTLPASRVVVTSGDGQTGAVAAALPQPFTVQVQASDGVGVGGASVAFSASVPGASVSPTSAITDSLGRASATMTLGTLAGTQTFTANVAGLSAATVHATATRGEATQITIVSGDAQVDTIGRALPRPFVVKVTDRFRNAVPEVVVVWTRVAGVGTLAATTTTTDATGEARVSYTLGVTPGTETIRATFSGASGDVTFTVTARSRPASRIEYVSGSDQSGVVGAAIPAPLVVRVRDDLGNTVAGASIAWTITGGGVLSTATTTTDAQGLTEVTATYPTTPGTFFVVARPAGSTIGGVQFQLEALTGPPATLVIAAGDGQSAPAGTAVSVAPAVSVADRFGNPVIGLAVSFTASGGGSVSGSPATTTAWGVATLGAWILGATAGAQTLTVTVGLLTVTFVATATAAVGPPVLSVMQQPSVIVANTQPFAVPPKVQLKTGAGAVLKTAGVAVTVALKTVGPTLRGTLTATTDTAGVATFNGLSLRGIRGNHVLMFTAPGNTGDTSQTFALTAGPAVSMAASSATTLSGVAGSVAAPTLTVIVTDSSGNTVGGVNVIFAVTDTAHGTVTGGATVTDTTGQASPGNWTLGHAVGTDTLSATAAGLSGSPVRFVATVTAGSATQLVKVSGDTQTGVTGNPLASPMVVEARDVFNNAVTGVAVSFATIAGGGSPTTANVTTDATGRAGFTLTLGPPGADTVRACLPSCATAQEFFSALSIPVGADAIWVGATSASWTTAGNWSPAVVPGGSNKVFIPAGTPFSPTLSGNVGVADLTMASGATLNVGTSQLALSGALLATGATMTGSTGYVYFCGGTHNFSGGSFSMITDCGATVSPAGTGTIAGSLTVQGGSVFDVGTSNVTVTGNVGMYGGARIKMMTAGGHLTVNGNYDSNPNNDIGDGWMTAGLLELKGNLTSNNGSYGQTFRAVGAHTTRFSGTSPQSVNFTYTDHFGRSTFGNVEFTGSANVTLVNNMRVFGTVTVTGTAKVLGGTIYHGGQLTTAAGTDLSGLASTELNGGGAVFPLVAGVGPQVINLVQGPFGAITVTLPNATVALPTNLATHAGAVLDLQDKTLTVTGNFGMYSGSRVAMQNAAAHFIVTGNYDSNPNNDIGDSWMTAGLLELKGNLTSNNGSYGQTFRAVGAHTTRFSGTSPQSVNFTYTDHFGRSTFGNVEFTGSANVTLVNNMRVFGTVTVTGTAKVSGGTIYHGGQLTTAAGTDLSGLASTELNGGGAVFPLVAGVGPQVINLVQGPFGAITVTLPNATVTLPTNLATHAGAVLDLQDKVLTVNGNFGMYSGSRVKMVQAATRLTVAGNFDSNPNNDIGDSWMTAGLLELKGNLTSNNGSYGQTFRAVGAHTTRFSGTSPQSVNFTYTDHFGRSTFGNVEFTGGNTVTLATNMRVFGTVTVTNSTVLTGNKTIYHGGQLTTAAGTDLSGLASTELNGGGAVFPLIAGVGPQVVNLVQGPFGAITVTLPNATVTLPTSLATHGGAVLDLQDKTLTVTGNFGMYSGSRVAMQNAAAHFIVNGNYDSNPNNDIGDGWMTDGVLELKGNLTSNNGSYGQTFRAVGAHITRFSGSSPQSVNFTYTDHFGRSTFGNVEFTGGNTVTLATNMRVFGTVTVTNSTVLTGNKTIYHGGQLTTAAGTDLSGLASTELNGGGAIFPLIAGVGPPVVNLVQGPFGAITVTLPNATVTLSTSLATHAGAVLALQDKTLTVTGNFGMYSGSRVAMQNAAAHFIVNGNYDSNPNNDIGDGWMTDGVLELKGNLTSNNGSYGQTFRAVGAHITRFSGTGAQSVSFRYTEHSGRSTFGKVEITNTSGAGLSTASGMWVLGTLTNSGRFTINAGHTVTAQGGVILGATSITTNSGGFNFPSCSLSGTPTKSGFTCPYP